MNRPVSRSAALLAALATLLLATGCGFQLRGWDLGANIDSAAVVTDGRSALARELEQSLSVSGVRLEESNPSITLRILSESTNRRTASVTGSARVAQYELTSTARYQIRNARGEALTPISTAQAVRVFSLDRNNIVGSSEEEALLEQEMRRDLIDQILRALNRVTESRAAATE